MVTECVKNILVTLVGLKNSLILEKSVNGSMNGIPDKVAFRYGKSAAVWISHISHSVHFSMNSR